MTDRDPKRTRELAPAQMRTYGAIRDYIERHGESPTLVELGEVLGLTPATVHRSVTLLVRSGFIAREPNVPRSLRILRPPPSFVLDAVAVPLVTTLESTRCPQESDQICLVPRHVIEAGAHFALKVPDDAMEGTGFREDDTVVVRWTPLPSHGAIIVSLLGGRVTIRRLSWLRDDITLYPDNPAFEPIPVTPRDDFRPVGEVVAWGARPR